MTGHKVDGLVCAYMIRASMYSVSMSIADKHAMLLVACGADSGTITVYIKRNNQKVYST